PVEIVPDPGPGAFGNPPRGEDAEAQFRVDETQLCVRVNHGNSLAAPARAWKEDFRTPSRRRLSRPAATARRRPALGPATFPARPRRARRARPRSSPGGTGWPPARP